MGNWDKGGSFVQPPTGPHNATLIRIVDIGTQVSEYKGQETVRRQNILTWELPHEKMDDGQPFIISKFYTASLGEKANLTKDLTSWFGKAPNPKDYDSAGQRALLGKHCQVVVSQREDSDKRVVSTVVGLAKGTDMPKTPHNPLVYFSLDEFDEEVFGNLSEGIQKIIMKSPEYEAIVNGTTPSEEVTEEDDIPF